MIKRPRHAHNFDREPLGHYVEPEWTSRRLFEVEEFGPPKAIVLDPACGWMRIPLAAAAAGYTAHAADVVDRRRRNSAESELARVFFTVRDFLTDPPIRRPWAIAVNPPYHLIREFTERAVEVAVFKIAVFMPVRRLPAAQWLRHLPLETIHLLTPRPSVPTGAYIEEGGKVGGGTQDFAWLVFNKRDTIVTAPRLRWLHRDGGAA